MQAYTVVAVARFKNFFAVRFLFHAIAAVAEVDEVASRRALLMHTDTRSPVAFFDQAVIVWRLHHAVAAESFLCCCRRCCCRGGCSGGAGDAGGGGCGRSRFRCDGRRGGTSRDGLRFGRNRAQQEEEKNAE